MGDCNAVGLVIIAGGVFALWAAVSDWEWFFNHPKAKLFTWLLGRTGARLFYGVLGLGLVGLGGAVLLGMVSPGGRKKAEKPDIVRKRIPNSAPGTSRSSTTTIRKPQRKEKWDFLNQSENPSIATNTFVSSWL